MTLFAASLVVLSGLVHSIWNLFAKRSIDKNVFLWCCQWAAILVFLPFVIREAAAMERVPVYGWLLLAVSMLLHGGYTLLLARAYSIGDMSKVYPVMRGTSPLLTPLIGVLLLGETLKLQGWVGVAAIVAGIVLVGGRDIWRKPDSAIVWAFLTGVMITGYTVVDKISLHYFPAITLNEATNVGNLLALSYAALASQGVRREWRANWPTILLGGVLAPGGYILFLKALEIAPVAQLAPMREIGTVFGTVMGIFILREVQGTSRILASVFITAGIIALAG